MLMIFCNSIMTASAKYHTHCNAFYKQQLYESCVKFSLIIPPSCEQGRKVWESCCWRHIAMLEICMPQWDCLNYMTPLQASDSHVNYRKNASQGNWICYWSSLEDIQLHVHSCNYTTELHSWCTDKSNSIILNLVLECQSEC